MTTAEPELNTSSKRAASPLLDAGAAVPFGGGLGNDKAFPSNASVGFTVPTRVIPRLLTALLVVVLGVLSQPSLPAADMLPQLTRLLQQSTDAQFQLDILRGMTDALKGRRSVAMPEGWSAVETRLAGSSDPQVRALAQSLSLTFGSTNALASLKQTLLDTSAKPEARRAALDSLLGVREGSLPPLLQNLLQDPALGRPALRALAGYDDSKTPAAILAAYGSLDDAGKRDALNTLAARPAFATSLTTALGDGRIPRQALTAELIRQLRSLKSADIDRQLTAIYGTVRDSDADKLKEIERYKRIYRAGGSTPGDGPRGRIVFNKVCVQCHVLFDAGGKVGPDITGANRTDLDYLLQNMVDPNAVIPNDYRASTVETRDGRSLTGIVKQQDDKSLTIVTQTEVLVLPKAEIQSQQLSELSMMPEGLLAPLQDQEVRDLIYYLGRPGQVGLSGDKP